MFDHSIFATPGAVSQITFTFTLTLLAWSDRYSVGTRWLAAACGLELLGTLTHHATEQSWNPLLVGLDRALVVVVFYLLYMGLRWFTIRRPHSGRSGPFLVGGSVLAVLAVSLRSQAAALALSRVASLVVLSVTLAILLRVRFAALRRCAFVLAGLIGSFMVLLTWRLALDLGLLGPDAAILQPFVRHATVVIFTLLSFTSVSMFVAESKRRLHQESREDALTGLRNRRSIEETAEREVRRARRLGYPLALLMLDLDHFKRLNDNFGHGAGDRALRAVGKLIAQQLGHKDFGARLGGEEFAVLLPGRDMEHAAFVGERLRRSLEAAFLVCDGHRLPITGSIGVSELASGETTWEPMLRRADHALYQAKCEGRNRVSLWSPGRECPPVSRTLPADDLWKLQISS